MSYAGFALWHQPGLLNVSEDIRRVLRKGFSAQYPRCASQSFSEMELMGGVILSVEVDPSVVST